MAEIFGVCYCVEPTCPRLFDIETLNDSPRDENGERILPCGHKFAMLTRSAIALRNDSIATLWQSK